LNRSAEASGSVDQVALRYYRLTKFGEHGQNRRVIAEFVNVLVPTRLVLPAQASEANRGTP
jgi:hypothetical protein